jgi:pyruvate formate lyase activating enzyme
MDGLVFDIRRFTVHDGPGIRSTVFFKGCPLSCSWCHNPESQSGLPETSNRSLALDGRIFREEEVSGVWMRTRDVIAEVIKDNVFYDESGGGVTISGGEPTFQPGFLSELLRGLKSWGLHVALDTCGHVEWARLAESMNFVDLYLYDIKVMDDDLHMKHTGVSNRQILENMLNLAAAGKKIMVRIPVIPGINDTDQNFTALKGYLGRMKPSITGINLLPFHTAAKNKYKRFGKDNFMKKAVSMPAEDLQSRKKELEAEGYIVKIGG